MQALGVDWPHPRREAEPLVSMLQVTARRRKGRSEWGDPIRYGTSQGGIPPNSASCSQCTSAVGSMLDTRERGRVAQGHAISSGFGKPRLRGPNSTRAPDQLGSVRGGTRTSSRCPVDCEDLHRPALQHRDTAVRSTVERALNQFKDGWASASSLEQYGPLASSLDVHRDDTRDVAQPAGARHLALTA